MASEYYSADLAANKTSRTTMTTAAAQQFTFDCVCESEKDTLYDRFLDPYFKWIDLLAYAIIPFLVMAICTYMITRVLFLSNRRLNKNKSKQHGATSAAASSAAAPGANGAATPTTSLLQKKQTNVRANKAKHLTYTLIVLNCLFFCLVSPLVITLIATDPNNGDYRMLTNIVYSVAYSNHSFNFLLYWLSSPPFRETALALLGRGRKQSPPNVNSAAVAAAANRLKNKAAAAENEKNNTTTNGNTNNPAGTKSTDVTAVNGGGGVVVQQEIVNQRDLNNNCVKRSEREVENQIFGDEGGDDDDGEEGEENADV
jgi:hypothetical protein